MANESKAGLLAGLLTVLVIALAFYQQQPEPTTDATHTVAPATPKPTTPQPDQIPSLGVPVVNRLP